MVPKGYRSGMTLHVHIKHEQEPANCIVHVVLRSLVTIPLPMGCVAVLCYLLKSAQS